jgi:hypothetical protein
MVAMQTRQPNLEGAGEIPLRRLVKEALRMPPLRIVVGEVRQEQCLGLATVDHRAGGRGTSISHTTVARIWHRFGVQPWRAGTFTFSTDPALEAKVRDVVALYPHPPEKAVVLCVDEKPQIRALERTPDPAGAARAPGGGQLPLQRPHRGSYGLCG